MPDTNPRTSTGSRLGDRAVDRPQEQLILVIDRAKPLDAGARHSLTNIDCVTIGRNRLRRAQRVVVDRLPTLSLAIADDSVSSLHARLERSPAGFGVVDCASRNGTRVNGRPIEIGGRVPLADGDLIEVGHTFFRYRAAVETPVTAPGDLDSSQVVGLARPLATICPRISRDAETLTRLASTDVAVLLLGETGTGKEVVARAIHAESGRTGAFVPVNCGALPANLVESLVFGHTRGAFSGALRDEPGLARAAHGGTLFLDEIGDPRSPRKPQSCAYSRSTRSCPWGPPGRVRPTCAWSPQRIGLCESSLRPAPFGRTYSPASRATSTICLR